MYFRMLIVPSALTGAPEAMSASSLSSVRVLDPDRRMAVTKFSFEMCSRFCSGILRLLMKIVEIVSDTPLTCDGIRANMCAVSPWWA